MIVLGFLILMCICACFVGAPVVAGIVTVVIMLGIYGIMLGYKQKNIFYHDTKDVIVNALVTIIFGAGGLSWLYQDIQYQAARNLDPIQYKSDWLGWTLTIFILSIFILYNLVYTLKYNKNIFTAVCIFCGRIVMGVSSILFLLGASSLWGDSRPNKVTQTASESLVGLITTLGLLAGYVELTKRLINKTRVKEQTDYFEVMN